MRSRSADPFRCKHGTWRPKSKVSDMTQAHERPALRSHSTRRRTMPECVDHDRRRLVGAAAMAAAAVQLGMSASADAQTSAPAAATSASFGPIKQIDTGVLDTGY